MTFFLFNPILYSKTQLTLNFHFLFFIRAFLAHANPKKYWVKITCAKSPQFLWPLDKAFFRLNLPRLTERLHHRRFSHALLFSIEEDFSSSHGVLQWQAFFRNKRILRENFNCFDDVVIETPCLFLTAHFGKVSIFSLQKFSKSAVNQWFSPLIAVV